MEIESKAKGNKARAAALNVFWWLGHSLYLIGEFHEGKVSPLRTGLIGYLLIAKVLLTIPVTYVSAHGAPVIAVLFFSFLRVNMMMYMATRVVKSMRVHGKTLNGKTARVPKWLLAVFTVDIGLTWLGFFLLIGVSFDLVSLSGS